MKPTIWLSPTIPISILLTIAIGSELLIGGLLRGEPYFVSQAIGQDIVTLGAALPALVVGAILASRGSERARPLWLGVLTYLVYTYIIYAFHVRFNPLFLVYVALLGCSLYALIGGLATTDFAHIKSRSSGKAPLRAVGIFLAVVVVLFYFSCLGEVVPALISGEVPQSVVDNGTPPTGSTCWTWPGSSPPRR